MMRSFQYSSGCRGSIPSTDVSMRFFSSTSPTTTLSFGAAGTAWSDKALTTTRHSAVIDASARRRPRFRSKAIRPVRENNIEKAFEKISLILTCRQKAWNQITPHDRFFLANEAVNFRRGAQQ